jgi:acyl carrier protein
MIVKKNQNIGQQIRQFILEEFPQANERSLGENETFLGSDIVDSLGIVKLMTFVETEFDITVEDEDLQPDNFQSIASLSEFVKTKLAQK